MSEDSALLIRGTTQSHPGQDAEVLWKFLWDTRQGVVESIFVATRRELETIIDREICFGEILGKHSEIEGILEAVDFKLLSDDLDFAQKFQTLVGSTGYCPLDYLEAE